MIPKSADVWETWRTFSRQQGFDTKRASRRSIAAALRTARKLANRAPHKRPAAVFFAFARRPSAFPKKARRRMNLILAATVARQLGLDLQATPQQQHQATLRIQGKLGKRWTFLRTYQEVEKWLAAFPGFPVTRM